MSRSRPAFTLFETVLVLALLVVLSAIAYPSMDAMFGYYKVTGSVDEVRAAWAQARAHAINDGVSYRFAVVAHKGNYRVAPDTSNYWSSNGSSAPAPADPANPPLVLERALPKGVCFGTPNGGVEASFEDETETVLPQGGVDPSAYAAVATFLPDGTAREDVEMGLYVRGTKTEVLKLRGLTGTVTATRVQGKGS